MTRTKSTCLTLLAVLLAPMAANADLIRIDAEAKLTVVSDFYIVFDDANDDGLLQWGEITEFSGFYLGSTLYDRIVSVATIAGISDYSFDPLAPFTWFENEFLYQRTDTGGYGNCFGGNGAGALECHNFSSTRLASVPEPGTLALFGLGLLGIGLARRRQKV